MINIEKLEDVLGTATCISFQENGHIGVHIPGAAKDKNTALIVVQAMNILIEEMGFKTIQPEGNA